MNQMKKKIFAVIAVLSISFTAVLGASYLSARADRKLLLKNEDEIFAEMQKLSSKKLIRKINKLESKLPAMEDKVNIMPLYHVLIGRADTFSDAQLIALMREPETLAGMECTLAEMYIRNGYGHTGLNAMLDDDDIAIETKEYIVSHADYSADELCGIFRKSENRTAVIAIKRISMCDSETALQLVNETLQAGKNGKEISDDQYIADKK